MSLKDNILVKIVAIILIVAFSFENVLWANPDVFKKSPPSAALQVQSSLKPMNPHIFRKFLLKATCQYIVDNIGEHIEEFEHTLLLPSKTGAELWFDFTPIDKDTEKSPYGTGKYKEGTNWIVPCSVSFNEEKWEGEAVIGDYDEYKKRPVSLRELGNLNDLLQEAKASYKCIPAFVACGMGLPTEDAIRAIIEAAMENYSPVIILIAPAILEKLGPAKIKQLPRQVREIVDRLKIELETTVPVFLGLDHSDNDMELIKEAINSGFGHITVDRAGGTSKDLADDIEQVRKIVEVAHARGVLVEGVIQETGEMTDPEEAERFARETGIDSMAICIGTIHEGRVEELDFDIAGQVRDSVGVPLVIHGGSSIQDKDLVRVPEFFAKINIGTAIKRTAEGVYVEHGPNAHAEARGAVKEMLSDKIKSLTTLGLAEEAGLPSTAGDAIVSANRDEEGREKWKTLPKRRKRSFIGRYAAWHEKWPLIRDTFLMKFISAHRNTSLKDWLSRSLGLIAIWTAMGATLSGAIRLSSLGFTLGPVPGFFILVTGTIVGLLVSFVGVNFLAHGIYNTLAALVPRFLSMLTLEKQDGKEAEKVEMIAVVAYMLGCLWFFSDPDNARERLRTATAEPGLLPPKTMEHAEALLRSLEGSSEDPTPHPEMNFYLPEKYTDETIKALELRLRQGLTDTEMAVTLNLLGYIYWRNKGDVASAERHFRKATQYNSNLLPAYLHLTEIFLTHYERTHSADELKKANVFCLEAMQLDLDGSTTAGGFMATIQEEQRKARWDAVDKKGLNISEHAEEESYKTGIPWIIFAVSNLISPNTYAFNMFIFLLCLEIAAVIFVIRHDEETLRKRSFIKSLLVFSAATLEAILGIVISAGGVYYISLLGFPLWLSLALQASIVIAAANVLAHYSLAWGVYFVRKKTHINLGYPTIKAGRIGKETPGLDEIKSPRRRAGEPRAEPYRRNKLVERGGIEARRRQKEKERYWRQLFNFMPKETKPTDEEEKHPKVRLDAVFSRFHMLIKNPSTEESEIESLGTLEGIDEGFFNRNGLSDIVSEFESGILDVDDECLVDERVYYDVIKPVYASIPVFIVYCFGFVSPDMWETYLLNRAKELALFSEEKKEKMQGKVEKAIKAEGLLKEGDIENADAFLSIIKTNFFSRNSLQGINKGYEKKAEKNEIILPHSKSDLCPRFILILEDLGFLRIDLFIRWLKDTINEYDFFKAANIMNITRLYIAMFPPISTEQQKEVDELGERIDRYLSDEIKELGRLRQERLKNTDRIASLMKTLRKYSASITALIKQNESEISRKQCEKLLAQEKERLGDLKDIAMCIFEMDTFKDAIEKRFGGFTHGERAIWSKPMSEKLEKDRSAHELIEEQLKTAIRELKTKAKALSVQYGKPPSRYKEKSQSWELLMRLAVKLRSRLPNEAVTITNLAKVSEDDDIPVSEQQIRVAMGICGGLPIYSVLWKQYEVTDIDLTIERGNFIKRSFKPGDYDLIDIEELKYVIEELEDAMPILGREKAKLYLRLEPDRKMLVEMCDDEGVSEEVKMQLSEDLAKTIEAKKKELKQYLEDAKSLLPTLKICLRGCRLESAISDAKKELSNNKNGDTVNANIVYAIKSLKASAKHLEPKTTESRSVNRLLTQLDEKLKKVNRRKVSSAASFELWKDAVYKDSGLTKTQIAQKISYLDEETGFGFFRYLFYLVRSKIGFKEWPKEVSILLGLLLSNRAISLGLSLLSMSFFPEIAPYLIPVIVNLNALVFSRMHGEQTKVQFVVRFWAGIIFNSIPLLALGFHVNFLGMILLSVLAHRLWNKVMPEKYRADMSGEGSPSINEQKKTMTIHSVRQAEHLHAGAAFTRLTSVVLIAAAGFLIPIAANYWPQITGFIESLKHSSKILPFLPVLGVGAGLLALVAKASDAGSGIPAALIEPVSALSTDPKFLPGSYSKSKIPSVLAKDWRRIQGCTVLEIAEILCVTKDGLKEFFKKYPHAIKFYNIEIRTGNELPLKYMRDNHKHARRLYNEGSHVKARQAFQSVVDLSKIVTDPELKVASEEISKLAAREMEKCDNLIRKEMEKIADMQFRAKRIEMWQNTMREAVKARGDLGGEGTGYRNRFTVYCSYGKDGVARIKPSAWEKFFTSGPARKTLVAYNAAEKAGFIEILGSIEPRLFILCDLGFISKTLWFNTIEQAIKDTDFKEASLFIRTFKSFAPEIYTFSDNEQKRLTKLEERLHKNFAARSKKVSVLIDRLKEGVLMAYALIETLKFYARFSSNLARSGKNSRLKNSALLYIVQKLSEEFTAEAGKVEEGWDELEELSRKESIPPTQTEPRGLGPATTKMMGKLKDEAIDFTVLANATTESIIGRTPKRNGNSTPRSLLLVGKKYVTDKAGLELLSIPHPDDTIKQKRERIWVLLKETDEEAEDEAEDEDFRIDKEEQMDDYDEENEQEAADAAASIAAAAEAAGRAAGAIPLVRKHFEEQLRSGHVSKILLMVIGIGAIFAASLFRYWPESAGSIVGLMHRSVIKDMIGLLPWAVVAAGVLLTGIFAVGTGNPTLRAFAKKPKSKENIVKRGNDKNHLLHFSKPSYVIDIKDYFNDLKNMGMKDLEWVELTRKESNMEVYAILKGSGKNNEKKIRLDMLALDKNGYIKGVKSVKKTKGSAISLSDAFRVQGRIAIGSSSTFFALKIKRSIEALAKYLRSEEKAASNGEGIERMLAQFTDSFIPPMDNLNKVPSVLNNNLDFYNNTSNLKKLCLTLSSYLDFDNNSPKQMATNIAVMHIIAYRVLNITNSLLNKEGHSKALHEALLPLARTVAKILDYEGEHKETFNGLLEYFVRYIPDGLVFQTIKKKDRWYSNREPELGKYLDDLFKAPSLTELGEVKFGVLARLGYKDAEEELVKGTMKFAVSIMREVTKKYKVPLIAIQDLVGVCSKALSKSAKEYKPQKGYRFTKFSHDMIVWCVEDVLLTEGTGVIQKPRWVGIAAISFKRAYKQAFGSGADFANTTLSPEEIAERVPGTSSSRVKTLMQSIQPSVLPVHEHKDDGNSRDDKEIQRGEIPPRESEGLEKQELPKLYTKIKKTLDAAVEEYLKGVECKVYPVWMRKLIYRKKILPILKSLLGEEVPPMPTEKQLAAELEMSRQNVGLIEKELRKIFIKTVVSILSKNLLAEQPVPRYRTYNVDDEEKRFGKQLTKKIRDSFALLDGVYPVKYREDISQIVGASLARFDTASIEALGKMGILNDKQVSAILDRKIDKFYTGELVEKIKIILNGYEEDGIPKFVQEDLIKYFITVEYIRKLQGKFRPRPFEEILFACANCPENPGALLQLFKVTPTDRKRHDENKMAKPFVTKFFNLVKNTTGPLAIIGIVLASIGATGTNTLNMFGFRLIALTALLYSFGFFIWPEPHEANHELLENASRQKAYKGFLEEARKFLGENKLSDAESRLLTAKAAIDTEPDLYELLGNVYFLQERYEKAIECAEREIELDPNFPGGYYRLANCLLGAESYGTNRLQRAERACRKAITLTARRGNFGPAYLTLGTILSHNEQTEDVDKKKDEAKECFRHVTELNPEHGFGFYALGKLIFAEDRTQGKSCLSEAARLDTKLLYVTGNDLVLMLEDMQARGVDKITDVVNDMVPTEEKLTPPLPIYDAIFFARSEQLFLKAGEFHFFGGGILLNTDGQEDVMYISTVEQASEFAIGEKGSVVISHDAGVVHTVGYRLAIDGKGIRSYINFGKRLGYALNNLVLNAKEKGNRNYTWKKVRIDWQIEDGEVKIDVTDEDRRELPKDSELSEDIRIIKFNIANKFEITPVFDNASKKIGTKYTIIMLSKEKWVRTTLTEIGNRKTAGRKRIIVHSKDPSVKTKFYPIYSKWLKDDVEGQRVYFNPVDKKFYFLADLTRKTTENIISRGNDRPAFSGLTFIALIAAAGFLIPLAANYWPHITGLIESLKDYLVSKGIFDMLPEIVKENFKLLVVTVAAVVSVLLALRVYKSIRETASYVGMILKIAAILGVIGVIAYFVVPGAPGLIDKVLQWFMSIKLPFGLGSAKILSFLPVLLGAALFFTSSFSEGGSSMGKKTHATDAAGSRDKRLESLRKEAQRLIAKEKDHKLDAFALLVYRGKLVKKVKALQALAREKEARPEVSVEGLSQWERIITDNLSIAGIKEFIDGINSITGLIEARMKDRIVLASQLNIAALGPMILEEGEVMAGAAIEESDINAFKEACMAMRNISIAASDSGRASRAKRVEALLESYEAQAKKAFANHPAVLALKKLPLARLEKMRGDGTAIKVTVTDVRIYKTSNTKLRQPIRKHTKKNSASGFGVLCRDTDGTKIKGFIHRDAIFKEKIEFKYETPEALKRFIGQSFWVQVESTDGREPTFMMAEEAARKSQRPPEDESSPGSSRKGKGPGATQAPAAPRLGAGMYLEDFDKLPEFAKNFVDTLIALGITGKATLIFSENIEDKNALNLAKTLEGLRKDPILRGLLKNIHSRVENPEDFDTAKEEAFKDGSSRVFIFAPSGDVDRKLKVEEEEEKVVGDLAKEKKVELVLINEKKYEPGIYYPLAEIVEITLLESLYPGTINRISAILKSLRIDANKINIDPNTICRNEIGALIFAITPKVGEDTGSGRLSRSARLRTHIRQSA